MRASSRSSRNGGVAPKITGVFPVPTYPNSTSKSKSKRYDNLRIQGEGFAQDACDNEVVLGSERVDVCWEGTGCANGITGKLVAGARTIQLSNISTLDHDLDNLKIRVRPQESEPVNIRLSRIGREAPIRLSLFLGILVFASVIFLGGLRSRLTIGGKNYGLISRLFIDAETETYSLSKFQFFVWTLVAVLAYLYLAIATWLIQGKLDFLDVPSGLPGIVLISAATTAVAQWATEHQRAKGAGGLYPTMSDFVSVGGVVVPERFQFFLWTLLGAKRSASHSKYHSKCQPFRLYLFAQKNRQPRQILCGATLHPLVSTAFWRVCLFGNSGESSGSVISPLKLRIWSRIS